MIKFFYNKIIITESIIKVKFQTSKRSPYDRQHKQIKFIQGNEACVEGALYAGLEFFAGYPITPSSEILHLLSELMPKVGGYLVQTEDELAAIGAVIGGSFSGVKSMTATSGPGATIATRAGGRNSARGSAKPRPPSPRWFPRLPPDRGGDDTNRFLSGAGPAPPLDYTSRYWFYAAGLVDSESQPVVGVDVTAAVGLVELDLVEELFFDDGPQTVDVPGDRVHAILSAGVGGTARDGSTLGDRQSIAGHTDTARASMSEPAAV